MQPMHSVHRKLQGKLYCRFQGSYHSFSPNALLIQRIWTNGSFYDTVKKPLENDSNFQTVSVDSDDDIVALDDDEVRLAAKKRSLESGSSSTTAADTSDATGPPVKKAKTVSADDDIVCIE